MKRLLSFFTAIILALSLQPVASFAMGAGDSEFEAFLAEIGWGKQDYLDYLESKGGSLDDYDSVIYLGTPLTEESIRPLLTDYGITRVELNELLTEFGDIEKGQDVLDIEFPFFAESLYEYVGYYLEMPVDGTPINDDNLQELLDDYGFSSKAELEKYMQRFEIYLDEFVTIEDLRESVAYYVNSKADLEERTKGLFQSLPLTANEVERLLEHFKEIDSENPNLKKQLTALSDRMIEFDDFESARELTAEQIADLLDISNQLLNLLQVDANYSLMKDGATKAITIQSLMALTSTNGADLLIQLNNKKGQNLADIVLTHEMFGSKLIKELGKDLQEALQFMKDTDVTPVKTATKAVEQTVKGGKLPNTASDYVQNSIVGLMIALVGVLVFRRVWMRGL
ncbi:processed acidic surface protein [Niallia circulans]|uniref:Processed acidic surface protein n=1 Tax=Niallia circulans TaxID=1397 RepID=A0A553SNB6_NIACI|nr:processed acidic surface protein [Niallia circulans]TRZ38489.1 processed acidic surface protein [Niallia circulans]